MTSSTFFPSVPPFPLTKPANSILLRDATAKARNSSQTGNVYERILGSITENELQELVHDSDLSITLNAAWALNRSAKRQHISPGAQRFLGVLESRTGLNVPQWWEVEATSAALGDRSKFLNEKLSNEIIGRYFPFSPFLERLGDGSYVFKVEKFDKAPLGLLARANISVKPQGDGVSVKADSVELRIDATRLSELASEYKFARYIDVRHKPPRVIVSLHDEFGSKFPFWCVDAQSGRLLWDGESWGYGAENLIAFRSGPWRHKVEVVIANHTVAVFGGGTSTYSVVYLEAYDIRSGKPLYRFASNYWFAKLGE
jgi:hypothetical protein